MGSVSAENVVWRIDDLYSGPADPELEADRLWCRDQAGEFAAAYRGGIATLDSAALLSAVRQLESLHERLHKLIAFGYLFFATQTQEPQASALWQSMQEFASLIHRDTLFFDIEWNRLDEQQAQNFLEDPALKHYQHHLQSLRRYRPHQLSEAEERLLAEKEPAGTPAWCTLFDKVVSQLRFGERRRTQSAVLSELYHPEGEVRRQAALELTEGISGVSHILTHLFNTVLLDKAITDRLRSYPHWLRARNLDNEADDTMVDALIAAVSSRYDIVHRYYRLKRVLLGVEELFDYDRYAPIPGSPDRVFSWEDAEGIVLEAYARFSPDMASVARNFFDLRWIHAPVMPGKRGGAFAHPTVPSAHPFILLNFTGTHRDIMTLAHELGHGVHQMLARTQGLYNSDTPLTTAESASVFGEMLVFRHLLEGITAPGERLALLCNKLEDTFATVFRQVSMNRFEDGVHNERRQQGELDADRLSDIWMETQNAMFGSSVQLLDHYRLWWSYIPHFVHSPGYVYAYAFGELLVLALYQQYREQGESFVPRYLELLEAGGKAGPDELLRPFDIDLTDSHFWHRGLAVLEGWLDEAEGLAEALRSDKPSAKEGRS